MLQQEQQSEFQRKKEKILQERGYTIMEYIGNRQNAIISLALDEQNHKIVVLKEINVDSQRDIEAALNEIRILASVNSEFVAKYINSFAIDNKVIFIVQEYVEGLDLFKRIYGFGQTNLTDLQIRRIIIQLLQCLHYLHYNNIIHGDVRLESIVLQESNQYCKCKFVSFEYSRFATDEQISKQSLLYSAPESLEDGIRGFKSDIWQLGCLYYQLLRRCHPFEHDDVAKVKKSIKQSLFQEVGSLQLNQILELLLNKNPDKRPECVEILEKFYEIKPDYRPGKIQIKNKIQYDQDQQSIEEGLSKFNNRPFNNRTRLQRHGSLVSFNQPQIQASSPRISVTQIQLTHPGQLFIILPK